MDRKSLIIMVISLAFLAAWFPITNKIFPPIPAPVKNTNTVVGATNQADLPTSTNNLTGTSNTNIPAAVQTNFLHARKSSLRSRTRMPSILSVRWVAL